MRYYDLDTYDKNEDNQYFTIEQFTGLHDKNGKEIYEGDIVTLRGGKKPKGKERNYYNTVVVFKDGGFTVKENISIFVDRYALNVSRVIGNIHENPELLKGVD